MSNDKQEKNIFEFLNDCQELCNKETTRLKAERNKFVKNGGKETSGEHRRLSRMIAQVLDCQTLLTNCSYGIKRGETKNIPNLLKCKLETMRSNFDDDANRFFVTKLIKAILDFFDINHRPASHHFFTQMQENSKVELQQLKSPSNPFDDDNEVKQESSKKSSNPFDDDAEEISKKSSNPFDDEEEPTTPQCQ